ELGVRHGGPEGHHRRGQQDDRKQGALHRENLPAAVFRRPAWRQGNHYEQGKSRPPADDPRRSPGGCNPLSPHTLDAPGNRPRDESGARSWPDRYAVPSRSWSRRCNPRRAKTNDPPPVKGGRVATVNRGGVLLSHPVSQAVPSALEGLTSLFGMGRGVT